MDERIRVTFDTDLQRRRFAVLLRVVPAILPAIFLAVWSALAAPALVLAWLTTSALGRTPRPLHRFLRGYVRYTAQVGAWLHLVSGRFPNPRRRDAHPVQLVAPRLPQRRLFAFFRIVLAVPCLVMGSVLGVVLAVSAVGAWFVSLARGRTTEGLRELGAFCVRYQAEVLAYVLFVTPHLPKLAPPV